MSAKPRASKATPPAFPLYLPALLLLVLLATLSLCFLSSPNLFVMLAFAVPARFLRLPAVLDRVPYSRPSIYRKMREGTFPQAISLGGKAVAWLESDIDNFINERIQASREPSPGPESDRVA
jgi:prophage regulatory protein